MDLDALFLSRIQFAFTISFHIIFPAFTIGLASWLARLEFEWLRTGNPQYKSLYKFWVKVFAVSFALGVVSAWMLLRHPHDAPEAKLAGARRSLSMALWFATIVTPIQIFVGDMHGLGVLHLQPTKL